MGESLAEQVARRIQRDAVCGDGRASGDRLPPVRDLAVRFGVSTATVSNALNLLSGQGVVRKRQGSGCFVASPSAAASPAGPLSSDPLLGLILPSASDSEIMMNICEGVDAVCRRRSLHLAMALTGWDYEREREEVGRLARAGCKAVVMYPTQRPRVDVTADFLNTEFPDLPIVLIDMAQPEQRRSQILFDNVRAGREMTELLLRAGHRRIAIVQVDREPGGLGHRSNADRIEGYEAALRAAGLRSRPEDRWIIHRRGLERVGEAEEAVDRWLTQEHRPTAVLALEDHFAVMLIRCARDRGVRIPEELTVTGFDNLSLARVFDPSFPSTAPDFRRAGELAADLALQEAEDPSQPRTLYVLPVPLCRTEAVTAPVAATLGASC